MELRELEVVVAIADEGSFTAAAHRLLIAQPAVSHQVLRLERRLGYRLFDRSARGAVPTAACVRLLPAARAALAAVAAVSDVAADGAAASTVLRVGAAYGMSRGSVAAAVRHALAAGLRVELTRAGSRQLADQVLADDLDLALMTVSAQHPRPGLRVRWLTAVPVVALVADDDPTPPTTPLVDLLERPLLLLGPSAGMRETLARVARLQDRTVAVVAELDDPELLCELAAEARGVVLLPLDLVPTATALRVVELTDSPLRHQPALVWSTRPQAERAIVAYRDTVLLAEPGTARTDLALSGQVPPEQAPPARRASRELPG